MGKHNQERAKVRAKRKLTPQYVPMETQDEMDRLSAQVETLAAGRHLNEAHDLMLKSYDSLQGIAAYRAMLASICADLGMLSKAREHIEAALAIDSAPDMLLAGSEVYQRCGYRALAHRARVTFLRAAPYNHPAYSMVREQALSYRRWLRAASAKDGLGDDRLAEDVHYRLDRARVALDERQFEKAAEFCRRAIESAPRFAPPRNNMAVALFQLGRVGYAIDQIETALKDCDPANAFALGCLVEYSLAIGDKARALDAGERLAALPASMIAVNPIQAVLGLGLAGRDADVERVVTGMMATDHDLLPVLYQYLGFALANLGRREEALKHLVRAQKSQGDSAFLDSTIAALRAGKPGRGMAQRYSYIPYDAWIPAWARESVWPSLGVEAGTHRITGWDTYELLDRFPQLPLVLEKMLFEEDLDQKSTSILQRMLAALDTPASRETLREYARLTGAETKPGTRSDARPAPSNQTKRGLSRIMDRVGRTRTKTKPATPEEQMPSVRLHREPTGIHPPEVTALLQKAMTALNQERLDEAIELYKRVIRMKPDAKDAYQNLSIAYAKSGDAASQMEYLNRALEIDPLYPFARCQLASIALVDHDVARAREVLEPLSAVRDWNVIAYTYYQYMLAHIALEQKDYKAALMHAERVEELDGDFPDLDLLLGITRAATGFEEMGKRFEKRQLITRQRQIATPIDRDPRLTDCAARLGKDGALAIIRAVGLPARTNIRLAALQERIVECLSESDLLERVVTKLSDRDAEALQAVMAHGGWLPWKEFASQFDSDSNELQYSFPIRPEERKTIMGRLRQRGLIFEGSVDGQAIVTLPIEMRDSLAKLLAARNKNLTPAA